MDSTAGILINQFSDHHPYILCIDNLNIRTTPKYVNIYNETPEALNKFCNEITSSDLMNKIDHNPFSNPNKNYSILESTIISAKENN